MRTPSTSHDVKQADDKRYAAPAGLVSAASSFDDDESDDFQPMSSEAAQAWRTRQPRGLIRFLLGYQLVAVLTVTGLLWMAEAIGWMGSISDRAVAVSFAYGGLAIVIPAALLAVGRSAIVLTHPTCNLLDIRSISLLSLSLHCRSKHLTNLTYWIVFQSTRPLRPSRHPW